MEGKVIRKSNLALRFYVSDGWTREQVRLLLKQDKDMERVIPKFFDVSDDERIKAVENSYSKGRISSEFNSDLFEDCSYFVAFNFTDNENVYSEKLLSKNKIVDMLAHTA